MPVEPASATTEWSARERQPLPGPLDHGVGGGQPGVGQVPVDGGQEPLERLDPAYQVVGQH